MKVLTALLTLLTLFTARAACQAQAPGEGYIKTADGVRLFYKVVGGGPETLVAVHGGPGNTLESIRADLEPLSKNRRVIYYDQRGGGRSDVIRDKKKLSVEKHVADLEAVRYQQVVNMLIWETMGDWNLLPRPGVVKAPVLIIHGPSDPIPVESSEAWARGYPHSRLLLVEGSGHLSHVEQPEVFFDAVETFLKGGWPAAAKQLQATAGKK